MGDIETIYNKLTQKRLGIGALGRTWKYGKGDGKNKQELTQEEKTLLCEKVVEHGSRSRAAQIYQHIYNVPSGTYAFNVCKNELNPTPNDDGDSSDEEDAAIHAAAAAAQRRRKKKQNQTRITQWDEDDHAGGRRRRRRKSRRKKKSRKSKRRKGFKS